MAIDKTTDLSLVGSSQIVDGSITSAKIGTGAVVAASIAAGAVGSAALTSGAAALNAVLTANGSGAASFLALSAATIDVQMFTSNGTWTKPAGKSAVYVFGVGGGAGGNGGAKQTSGNAATGGNGGNGGAHNYQWFNASILSATVSVTIGAGGSGGAARTTTGWQTDAGHGGDTTFGAYLTAIGATGSTGAVNQYGYDRLPTVYGRKEYDTGDPYSATPRTVSGNYIPNAGQDLLYNFSYIGRGFIQGGVGAYSQTVYGRPSADCLFGAAGGGAGGEKQSSDVANFGGAGGRGFGLTLDTAAAGGTAGGNAGSAAGTQGYGNGGAGGGSGTLSTAGGAGGAGWLGGGGGGGGASQSGNSGAGGAGGGGWMLVISM